MQSRIPLNRNAHPPLVGKHTHTHRHIIERQRKKETERKSEEIPQSVGAQMYKTGKVLLSQIKGSISPPSLRYCCHSLSLSILVPRFPTTHDFTHIWCKPRQREGMKWDERKRKDEPVTFDRLGKAFFPHHGPAPLLFAIFPTCFNKAPFLSWYPISQPIPFSFRQCVWLCLCLTLPFLCTLCPCIPGNRWYHLVQSWEQGLKQEGEAACRVYKIWCILPHFCVFFPLCVSLLSAAF